MTILGVDYGRKYLGLALATSRDGSGQPLVVPLPALKFEGSSQALDGLIKTCEQYGVGEVVFGLPVLGSGKEGGLSKEIRRFSLVLSRKAKKERGLNLAVHFTNENLTSFEAGTMTWDIKKTREGKRKLENSLAACLILKNFLEFNPKFTKA